MILKRKKRFLENLIQKISNLKNNYSIVNTQFFAGGLRTYKYDGSYYT